uniref:Psbz n=1 Tax=Artemisia biennis TaxID=206550 RepID=F2XWY1_9ASTR|nr:Psbz [Artemisia biennis]
MTLAFPIGCFCINCYFINFIDWRTRCICFSCWWVKYQKCCIFRYIVMAWISFFGGYPNFFHLLNLLS